MIHESSYWKHALIRQVAILRGKLEQRSWRDSSFARLEQAIMLGSYIVRKLAESKKISEKVYQHPLKMRAFAATGEVVTLLNNHRINDLYHLKSGRSIRKPLSYVANQMIHSYVFVPIFETRTQIFGVAFNSDRSKQTDLYMIGLEEIISVFSRCANYYAQSMTVFRINDGSGFEVVLDDDR